MAETMSAPAIPNSRAIRRRRLRGRVSRATAGGALLIVAGFIIATSVPVQALITPGQAEAAVSRQSGGAQSLVVGNAAEVGTNRDTYSVSATPTYVGSDSSTFTNNPDGTIQWPFLTSVPISSGFGARNVSGCSFCSTFHQGIDFAPSAGTPIRVVASGVVTKVRARDGGFGNVVWVEHNVDGKQFVSVYGHMKDNSFMVTEGQKVNVGDELGLVGSTGNSTGPHLHLEIHLNNTPVDPLAWLRANAN